MEEKLRESALAFVNVLEQNDLVRSFLSAQDAFEKDQEVAELRSRYTEKLQTLQSKQLDGTLTQADVSALRSIQDLLNTHATTVSFIEARASLLETLTGCNAAISDLLGFDFAATAAPAAAC